MSALYAWKESSYSAQIRDFLFLLYPLSFPLRNFPIRSYRRILTAFLLYQLLYSKSFALSGQRTIRPTNKNVCAFADEETRLDGIVRYLGRGPVSVIALLE